MGRSRLWVRLLVVLVMFEVVTWAAFRLYLGRALGNVLYDPPITQAVAEFDRYMERRDPVLGWPQPDRFGQGSLDATGSRVIPAFPTPGNACVALYGDSFAFGDEVDDEHAWSNVLSKLLGCRVANYGMNGYGTDQALLRFRGNQRDEARTLILTVYPHNAQRIVNQFRAFITGEGSYLSFKPRFLAGRDGVLELVPLPTFTKTQFEELLQNPAPYLPQEYFLPGTPPGPVPFRFPYTWMLVRLLRNDQVRAGIDAVVTKQPAWSGFYEPGHPSGSFQVMAGILESFTREAGTRGKRALVFVLPTPSAIAYFQRTGTWAYGKLIAQVAGHGVDVVNMGPPFLEHLKGRPFIEITSQPTTGGGHFSEEGYAMLAEIAQGLLRDRGLPQ